MKKILITIILLIITVGIYGQSISVVEPGGNWATARGTINANFEVTSDSLTILNTIKAPVASPTFTGNVTIATLILGSTTITSNGTELNILDGALVNATELNRLVGVTSSVQTQLNGKQETLVSGTNIKTINSESLLGSGNITITGGEGSVDSSVYSTIWKVTKIVEDSLNAARGSATQVIAASDSMGTAGDNPKYVTPNDLETASVAVDSAIFVTVTRLTDSLNVLRSQIADIIAAVEAIGIDLTAPVVDSIELGRFADDTLAVFLSEVVHQDSVPPLTAFYLTEDGEEMGLADVLIQNDTLLIALDSAGVYGATYLLDYTRDYPYLQDSSLNRTASFTNKAVTNNLEAPAGYPSQMADGHTVAAWDFTDSDDLTLDGTDIDAAADVSGEGLDLTYVSGTNPQWNASGWAEFDDTDELKNTAISETQAYTIWMLIRIDTWTNNDYYFRTDNGDVKAIQVYSSPRLAINAGSALATESGDQSLDTWIVVKFEVNGASSEIQIDNGTERQGGAGSNNISQFRLGEESNSADFDIRFLWIRDQVDSAGDQSDIYDFLNSLKL